VREWVDGSTRKTFDTSLKVNIKAMLNKDFLFCFLRGGFSPLYSSSSSSFFFFGSHFKQCRAACVGDELQLPFFPFSLHSFTHERVGGE
jgi:hypothetical protein